MIESGYDLITGVAPEYTGLFFTFVTLKMDGAVLIAPFTKDSWTVRDFLIILPIGFGIPVHVKDLKLFQLQ